MKSNNYQFVQKHLRNSKSRTQFYHKLHECGLELHYHGNGKGKYPIGFRDGTKVVKFSSLGIKPEHIQELDVKALNHRLGRLEELERHRNQKTHGRSLDRS